MTGRRCTASILLAALVMLAGCAVHRPQAITPPAPLPAAFAGQAAEATPPLGPWWQAFGDPRLDALVVEAFAGNLDLAGAVARLEQLEALARQSAAARSPVLNIEGRASRDAQPSFAGDFTGNSHSLSLAAGYEPDLWNKLKSRTAAARLEAEASREEIHALYLGLSARVADLYYLALEQRAQLELTDRTVGSFADTLERVERRYREGLVPALDIYQARQTLAAARARRPLFEASLASAEYALASLLGRFPGPLPAAGLPALPEAPEAFPAGLPSQLLARRPDVRAALRRVEAADAGVAAAIAERFPSFNLLGSYGTSRTAFSTGIISGDFWGMALSLAQPLIDGGRRKAEVERSRAAFRERLAGYRQSVLSAFQEVEDALARNRATEQRISRLAERASATEASLRLSTERYLQGLSDYLPVLTAQALLLDAEGQLLASRRQLIADRITLARALGGSWMETELDHKLNTAQTEGQQR
ncbi:efflux transporter outer membrane subunit [uncultured Desulfuromonas sp.]|uniref:efflux transporter outer membrane subunit n=1 Tax=uncultured Desulfuromonas sp. TaxID=181013 RepID=UPI0026154D8F|nr:efflux transporter outer membrane subunit [uncultured Desulfuromonas sp.]